jgi:ethanolamine ammonia-lyase small subunit
VTDITPITPDPWHPLRQTTTARIALGRAGGSLPTDEWLRFKAAHAAARDAVHCPFRSEALADCIAGLGRESIIVDSAAGDRTTYLQRPDLGRQLNDSSRQLLEKFTPSHRSCDLVIIISDGLSATAVERQAPALLAELLPRLDAAGWRLAPIVLARFGRVALEDQIGQLFSAQMALILIGERPGLGSPDSLGAYLIHAPQMGKTDADRNCVSNIRPLGLDIAAAADTIFYLLTESCRRKLSGVQLKDQRCWTQSRSPGAISTRCM